MMIVTKQAERRFEERHRAKVSKVNSYFLIIIQSLNIESPNAGLTSYIFGHILGFLLFFLSCVGRRPDQNNHHNNLHDNISWLSMLAQGDGDGCFVDTIASVSIANQHCRHHHCHHQCHHQCHHCHHHCHHQCHHCHQNHDYDHCLIILLIMIFIQSSS